MCLSSSNVGGRRQGPETRALLAFHMSKSTDRLAQRQFSVISQVRPTTTFLLSRTVSESCLVRLR